MVVIYLWMSCHTDIQRRKHTSDDLTSSHDFDMTDLSFQGLKVRHIRSYQSTPTDLASIRLSIPGLSLAHMLKMNPNPSLDHSQIRMSTFLCNPPNVIGYSALCSGSGTLSIHSHVSEADIKFYRNFERYPSRSMGDGVWIYMPVDSNEYLEEIFVQKQREGRLPICGSGNLIVSRINIVKLVFSC